MEQQELEALEKQAKELLAQGNKKEADKIFRILKRERSRRKQ